MQAIFEPDFQAKVLYISFAAGSILNSKNDVLAWRSQWMDALKVWHSPYKAIIDCGNLDLNAEATELEEYLGRMHVFFQGLFLRKAVGFGRREGAGHERLPFPVFGEREEALSAAGIRSFEKKNAVAGQDLRRSIQFENHFKQHVIELSFNEDAVISTAEDLAVLGSKLQNNLMLWHSSWSLLIDCSHFELIPELHEAFSKLEKRWRGFFMKKVIGYAPRNKVASYPFVVYRARHKAVAELESEGLFSGADANCQSRKS